MSLTYLPNALPPDDVLTLDVEDHCLRTLEIREGGVHWWAEEPLPPRAVQRGCVVDVPTVSAAIRTLLTARTPSPGPLLVSLGGCGSVARLLTVSVRREHLSHAILQAYRDLVGDEDALYLSWQVLQRKNGWQKVLLLGVRRQVLDTQTHALSAAGLYSRSGPKPLALARTIDHHQAVIANLEPGIADIVVVTARVPVIARSLSPVRGDEHQVLDWLADEIRQIIVSYGQLHGEVPLPETEIFVGGSQLESPAAREYLASRLDRPVRLPDTALETPSDFPLPRFLVNVGLAFCATLPRTS